MRALVTGGAGLIGSALVRQLVALDHSVLNVDVLTYAGSLESVESVAGDPRYAFEQVDIVDAPAMNRIFSEFQPDCVLHLAAEAHVNRSIDNSASIVRTNVVGTHVMLCETLRYWRSLKPAAQKTFRFVHVSTDEVFGSLDDTGTFSEHARYAPNSPYAATQASADHLVRAWHHTYGLPCIVTNCSNNLGPYQLPEKLIPLIINNALERRELPVYGRGGNVRDWLYVEDHADALIRVASHGTVGATYLIGGRNERRKIDVVETTCVVVDAIRPEPHTRRSLIRFVTDRPGHDHRYAVDPSAIERDLGSKAANTFETALERTVRWYLENEWWRVRLEAKGNVRTRQGLEAIKAAAEVA